MSNRCSSVLMALLGSTALPVPALAGELPTGGNIVSGSGSISTQGSTLTVHQTSDRLVTNWNSFSIGGTNSVVFQQPSSSSVALNRVTGVEPSHIRGALSANGQVFLVNPNGVVFGAGSQVNTAALVASTLDIADGDFLAGKYTFSGTGGSIANDGSLNGKVVALIAPEVTNAGTITGDTALAAGTKVGLDFGGDGLISVKVEESTLSTLVDNKGAVKAPGGTVIFTAKGASAAKASVINNSGTVEAKGMVNKNGRILLLGDMESGSVKVSGTLDASAPDHGNGGFIETSAKKVTIADKARITTRSAHGKSGHFLIDPTNYTIAASGGDMTGAMLTSLLASNGSVTVQSISGGAGTEGDIYVNDAVSWGNGSTLTLEAQNDIVVNGALNVTGTGGLVFSYGQATPVLNNTSTYVVRGEVNLASTASFQTKQGSDGTAINYSIINSAAELQAIGDASNLGNTPGHYVLGSNLDLSSISNFAPIVNISGTLQPEGRDAFVGIFDGLGHTLSNLSINRPTLEGVGLFGFVGGDGVIRNFTISGGNVTGGYTVGAAAGMVSSGGFGANEAQVVNVGAQGVTVTSNNDGAGGLIGRNRGIVSGSYATGNVAANGASGFGASAGGLVGINQGSIADSYATGNVTGVTRAGGLVGDDIGGDVANTYATGAVSAATAGGLIGEASGTTISNSYFLDTGPDNGSGQAITSAQLRTPSTFSGWSMASSGGQKTIWRIYEGQSGPLLSAFLRPITVAANSGTAVYSGSTPSFGVTYASFAGAVDLGLLMGTAIIGGGGSNAGNYTITPEGLYSGQAGYDISYVAGSLSITPAALTVTANGDSRSYSGTGYTGGNGVSYSGFVNGEDASVLSGSLVYGGSAQGARNAGSYAISASGLTSGNYSISYVDGSLSITPAALTVTANGDSRSYSGAGYAGGNGVSYSGFVNGEDASVLSGSLVYGGSAQGAKNAGSYAISASGLSSGNYSISYADGSLSITPAALTVTANGDSRSYSGASYTGGNGVSYSGFVNGEDASVLSGSLVYGGSAQGAKNAGTYAISASGLSSSNYAITWVNGLLSILPAAAVPTATPSRLPLWPQTTSSPSPLVTDVGLLPVPVNFIGDLRRDPLLYPHGGRTLLVTTRPDPAGANIVTLPRTVAPTEELLVGLEKSAGGKTGRLTRFTQDARGCGCLMRDEVN
ncbi:filamentous hemagglutinin N-terminal domain-containing protein (plasmid) [Ensifer sp. PDNC004]|uniref:MBG domain-containing protein n=1 Tax=Ensifer sp. PDNC004 TaxID=2811423 RepID=UPI001966651B|nr:MBG domain-containing protein [Ensifer sp. PDNC004]QRY70605.1 filamentous hemagglutinin N-terminal domain-containing protein [Ensifer sp. PDNC004]